MNDLSAFKEQAERLQAALAKGDAVEAALQQAITWLIPSVNADYFMEGKLPRNFMRNAQENRLALMQNPAEIHPPPLDPESLAYKVNAGLWDAEMNGADDLTAILLSIWGVPKANEQPSWKYSITVEGRRQTYGKAPVNLQKRVGRRRCHF